MISVILRTTVMFILIIFAMRIMGKKNLGEFQPSDLVSTIIISNLTSLVIEAPELPIINSIIPILLIMCFEVFISVIVKKNEKFAHIVQGKSIIIIQNGIINQTALKELRFSVDDVLESLRSKDIFYIEEVFLAIVETTGNISIYKDPNAQSNIKKGIIPALPVIIDGKIIYSNLLTTGFEIDKIENITNKNNYIIENILLMTIDSNGHYNITMKEDV